MKRFIWQVSGMLEVQADSYRSGGPLVYILEREADGVMSKPLHDMICHADHHPPGDPYCPVRPKNGLEGYVAEAQKLIKAHTDLAAELAEAKKKIRELEEFIRNTPGAVLT